MVNGGKVKDVEEYLGATVDKEGGGSKDITNRPQKTRKGMGSQRSRKENQDACSRLHFDRPYYMAVKRERSQRLMKEN